MRIKKTLDLQNFCINADINPGRLGATGDRLWFWLSQTAVYFYYEFFKQRVPVWVLVPMVAGVGCSAE